MKPWRRPRTGGYQVADARPETLTAPRGRAGTTTARVSADLTLMANPEGDQRILERARELGRQFNESYLPKVVPGQIGWDLYLGGRLAERVMECPQHGRWSFPPTNEGQCAAARFAAEHAGHAAPLPRQRRPRNKSRRAR